ncbi:ornithine cyclodeaminase [Phytomonospora endophytica]|uniref:Ornithine cyclodeaminase n=1 Tax=Phytomonospora endophytica TaxID=714109 RepID=A0A841FVK2_9ACTN|nr:ornithine cyclodeaminase [Phytomonospora endophytica]MBB6040036.1 ornithine cyclodeaminase [Phytomonospora endophytica]GIG71591.1 ornithine cyclodeaminase [Phytomonospora endophytica]
MDDGFLYLTEADVMASLPDVDAVGVMATVHRRHAEGRTTLPQESYLRWTTPSGAMARNLALAGHLDGAVPEMGIKVINGSLSNPDNGLPRASGITLLFDPETARIRCVMEGARISAVRTAANSVLAFRMYAGPDADTMAIIGAGVIGAAHLDVALASLPTLRHIHFHDVVGERARRILADRAATITAAGVRCTVVDTPEQAVRRSDWVVAATTTAEPYISWNWLRPRAVVSNVGLDDVHHEVYERAATLLVDDWSLVAADEFRTLGHLHRSGVVAAPDAPLNGAARRVDAVLGNALGPETTVEDVVPTPGLAAAEGVVLFNPFGMAICDVALAAEVERHARRLGLGQTIRR